MTPKQAREVVTLLRRLEETNMCLNSLGMTHNESEIKTTMGRVQVRSESVRPILEAHRDWLSMQIRDLGVTLP